MVSLELIEHMEEKFPNRLPPQGSSVQALHEAWGAQEVIQYLRALYESQKEQPENVPRSKTSVTIGGPGPDPAV